MSVRAITINNATYNVAQAPALQQKKLMLLVGALIAARSQASGQPINTSLLMGALMILPETKFDEVANIVLYKTIISGAATPIDVGSFQGKMTDYFKLVAEAIAYNLDDFFTFLASEKPDEATRGN